MLMLREMQHRAVLQDLALPSAERRGCCGKVASEADTSLQPGFCCIPAAGRDVDRVWDGSCVSLCREGMLGVLLAARGTVDFSVLEPTLPAR